ncbi:hypothetical protein LCGC14_1306390 [marine sediment metagenome]|uniref:Uncharacterized protein n=1 Tax=marine sediment metagenome TaxID=412755 RepID=A0A0F9KNM3_9ZZZZ
MTYVVVVTIASRVRVYGQWYMREDAEDWAEKGCIGLSYEIVQLEMVP